MKDKVLVGTFIDDNVMPRRVLRDITEFFDVRKVFVFDLSLNEDSKQFLFTFNINKKEKSLEDFKEKYRKTIHLHRNKEYNTLFTINSLNCIIEKQHKGVLRENDHENYKVDWTEYKNSCVLLDRNDNVKVIPTRLYDIIDFD